MTILSHGARKLLSKIRQRTTDWSVMLGKEYRPGADPRLKSHIFTTLEKVHSSLVLQTRASLRTHSVARLLLVSQTPLLPFFPNLYYGQLGSRITRTVTSKMLKHSEEGKCDGDECRRRVARPVWGAQVELPHPHSHCKGPEPDGTHMLLMTNHQPLQGEVCRSGHARRGCQSSSQPMPRLHSCHHC